MIDPITFFICGASLIACFFGFYFMGKNSGYAEKTYEILQYRNSKPTSESYNKNIHDRVSKELKQ